MLWVNLRVGLRFRGHLGFLHTVIVFGSGFFVSAPQKGHRGWLLKKPHNLPKH